MRIKTNRLSCFTLMATLAAFAAAPVLGSAPHHSPHGGAAFLSPASRAEASAPANSGEGKILYYQDPMHPWYRSDKPGIAPDCGMKLVAVYASDAPAAALPPGGVQINPSRQQIMGVTSARAEYRNVDRPIHATAQVAIDETRQVSVHVRTSGWIQKVFVDYTFQYVKKGEPLFTFYSPELFAAEQEYLLALKAGRELGSSTIQGVALGGMNLLESSRRRLELLDLTEDQIRDLEHTGKPQREITIYSPATGHVVERKALPSQYITPDMELYKLSDHAAVWVIAEVYEPDTPFIELGQQATLTAESLPGRRLSGHVTFIPPHVMEETRTMPVRLEFPNDKDELKPGMFVTVDLHRGLGRQLTVPVDAVLDSGTHQRVFVDRGKGVFEPRTVTVGARSGDYAVILSGLRAGEQVVTRANFLIDSESNLRQSAEGMQK